MRFLKRHPLNAFAAMLMSPVLILVGCGGGSTVGVDQNAPTIATSPRPVSVPVNGTVTFTAQTKNASTGTPTWSLGSTGASVGTLSSSSGTTITYTAPSTPPIYSGAFQLYPAMQGTVTLQAGVLGPFGDALDRVSFSIIAPSVTTGITPASADVALGTTMQFYGYAVGNLDNALSFQVNGVTGGSPSSGLVTNTSSDPGLYIAPSTMPITGNTVTITVVSSADPTKSSSAVVTLH